MELSQVEQVLLGYLKTSKAKKGTQLIVFLALKEENQMIEMCEFLDENEQATDEEILSVAKRIGGPDCGIF